MPFVSGIESMMNCVLRFLLGALDSDEREVVSGDLLEAQESPSASVFQVLSLITHSLDWVATLACPHYRRIPVGCRAFSVRKRLLSLECGLLLDVD